MFQKVLKIKTELKIQQIIDNLINVTIISIQSYIVIYNVSLDRLTSYKVFFIAKMQYINKASLVLLISLTLMKFFTGGFIAFIY